MLLSLLQRLRQSLRLRGGRPLRCNNLIMRRGRSRRYWNVSLRLVRQRLRLELGGDLDLHHGWWWGASTLRGDPGVLMIAAARWCGAGATLRLRLA